MGKITCSICGMSSFVKQDGVFICSTCGHKYSVDEIQKLLSSNEQSTSKDNCDDVIHDIPNIQKCVKMICHGKLIVKLSLLEIS